jgi:hypothetical protein
MQRKFAAALVAVCILAITLAALDVRCGLARPAGDTVVLACRAGRLTALAQGVQP